MKSLFVAALLLFSTIASADIVRGGGNQNRDINQRLSELERTVYDLNQRISNLERGMRPIPPAPPVAKDVACMVTASTFGTVFIGKGHTTLDAKANALQSCQASLSGMYCQNVTCDDAQKNAYIRGATCVLNASTFNTTFKGEGSSLIEAEYNARKACNNQYSGMYCTGAIQCESY